MSAERKIEKGDRFETLEGRDAGRVVEVVETLGLLPSAERHIRLIVARGGSEAHVERVRARRTYFRVRTEAHPKNADAIGNVSRVSERTLRRRYRRVSR